MTSSINKISHDIKHRKHARDNFHTPVKLAEHLISLVPLKKKDIVLDPCRGRGAFYNNFPDYIYPAWAEINEGRDFFDLDDQYHWCISNPPYSKIDKWLNHSCEVSIKGFAYLIGVINLTARRIEMCNNYGFGLTKFHMFKVFKWYGMSCFVVFEKGKENVITYNRVVWREDK